jgi:hypothetical protein
VAEGSNRDSRGSKGQRRFEQEIPTLAPAPAAAIRATGSRAERCGAHSR